MLKEKFSFTLIRRHVIYAWIFTTFPCAAIAAEAAAQADNTPLIDIPFDQLVETEVITAAKVARQVSDAPSAVSIVTAEDIRNYGYRTLAEVIGSMRGLYTSYDRIYTYMGGRGFGRTGDYAGRVMLLIDGYQANDNLYNASYLGHDGLLDTELIDRVEYVSGPGSVTYGNGAFYGIINIITKKGHDFNGLQVSASIGSYGTNKERITYGKRLENGADILVSTSVYKSNGQNLHFKEYNSPATNNGNARNLDEEGNRRYFAKAQFEQWALEGGYVNRIKDDPTASYGADFNVRPNWVRDASGFVSLKHNDSIGKDVNTSTQLYYGQYTYNARAVYSGDPYKETDVGRWWGVDSKLTDTHFANHKILLGGEYRSDYQQDFYLPVGAIRHNSYMASVYAQDEYTLTDNINLNFGTRLDYSGERKSSYISPRLALMYSPLTTTTIKASYASAFRRPNAYEKYYDDGTSQVANTGLKKELVNAAELVLEHRPDSKTRLLGSLYHYYTRKLIASDEYVFDSTFQQYINLSDSKTKGFDIELERRWDSGMHIRSSYAWQLAEDNQGLWLTNSPKHLAKLNFSMPLMHKKIRAGLDLQYIGERVSEFRTVVGGYTLVNLTLTSLAIVPNLQVSASIRNLFDRNYAHIASSAAMPITAIPQDGRNFWLQMTYDFK